MKPPGLVIGMNSAGLVMRVTHPTHTEDKVWDAVQEAFAEGWTADRFRREVLSAWIQCAEEIAEAAASDAKKAFKS